MAPSSQHPDDGERPAGRRLHPNTLARIREVLRAYDEREFDTQRAVNEIARAVDRDDKQWQRQRNRRGGDR